MTDATTEQRTYGNWFPQRSPGLLGAGLIGTVVLFGGIFSALMALLIGGWRVALVVAVIGGLAFTATGTPIGGMIARRVNYTRAKVSRDTEFSSGVATKKPDPANRLPGVLGRSRLLSGTDNLGSPFAVVQHGPLYSVVARCAAEGPWMQDQDQIDSWVSHWSIVLATAGQEPGLVCIKAISDTAPDPGGHLGSMVNSLRVSGSPGLARQVMDECVADLPASSSENHVYIEMTYRGRELNRRGQQDAILRELARKVPGLVNMLTSAGGGSVEMVTGEELAKLVRVSYDPAVGPALEQAALNPWITQPDTTWTEAGPVATRETWGEFLHDSGRSVTWEMVKAPTMKVTEMALAGLCSPHSDFARKRVALMYRPHTPDQSAKVAERDASTANFAMQSTKRRPKASTRLVQEAAEQSRTEVATGAGSVRFSLMVTATVLHDGDLEQAVATLESRAGAVPVRLRRCYGAQAASFAATLPAGFVPWEHSLISTSIRELA